MGNGIANSRCGRLEGDLEGDLENGLGEVGVASMEAEEGDLGEEEARRRVRVEGCFGVGRGGSSAMGMVGTGSTN